MSQFSLLLGKNFMEVFVDRHFLAFFDSLVKFNFKSQLIEILLNCVSLLGGDWDWERTGNLVVGCALDLNLGIDFLVDFEVIILSKEDMFEQLVLGEYLDDLFHDRLGIE